MLVSFQYSLDSSAQDLFSLKVIAHFYLKKKADNPTIVWDGALYNNS